jgi:hypothetical protein
MKTTGKTVGDERPKITDEEIGKIQRKTNELVRRVSEGTITFDDVITGMQDIIEGKFRRLKLDFNHGKKWYGVDGVIYIKLISDGATGEEWIKRLEKRGIQLTQAAKDLLLSDNFKPTTGVIYTIAILKSDLFVEGDSTTENVICEALKRKMVTPNLEVACLLREMFWDKEIEEMGFYWVTIFHKPFEDNDGSLNFLSTDRDSDGVWLSVRCDKFNFGWGSHRGFVFEVSQEKVV